MGIRERWKLHDKPVFEFGKRLLAYRGMKNFTLEELKELTGISTSTLSKLENGENEPTLDSLKKLSKAYGISLDDLVGGDDGYLASLSDDEDDFLGYHQNPYELSEGIHGPIHSIDGIELNAEETKQIVNYARFLVLQREEMSVEILKKVTKFIKQREESE